MVLILENVVFKSNILQETGRGFGLERSTFIDLYRRYFDSHFNNAITLGLACLVCIFTMVRVKFRIDDF